jgi:hypothetical protein
MNLFLTNLMKIEGQCIKKSQRKHETSKFQLIVCELKNMWFIPLGIVTNYEEAKGNGHTKI